MSAEVDLTDSRATVLAVTWLAGIAGHEVGDYLIQLDCDAQAKQHQTRAGRFALARHAITYAATQAAMKWIAYRATGVRVSGRALLAGTVVEGLLHAVIDDGRLLRRLADVTGKRAFHDLADHGVNGRMLMDQAVHKGVQIPVGAVVTVMVAGGAR